MNVLSTFDVRSILACQLLLSAAFAIVFLAMMFAYRQLNGIGAIAFGFLVCAPGILLLTLRGSISDLASIVLANALILYAYLYFYLGILRFFAGRHKPQPAAIWSATLTVILAVALTAWFSGAHPAVIPRVLTISLASAFLCSLIAYELLRQATGRLTLYLFSCFMFLYAALNIARGIITIRSGNPPFLLQPGNPQILAIIASLVFICGFGIFFQIMIAGELTHAVEHRARHDLLTGTLNRTGIESRLCGELDRAHRNGHPLSALLIDIDHFKSINDTHGHAAGDQALRAVAQSIASSLRSYDLLGRYGGDEFLLLLPETPSRSALEVAERIRTLLTNAPQPPGSSIQRPTVSIGLTETLPLDTTASLLARADAALYDAKHAGRNCVRRRLSSAAHPSRPSDYPSAGRSGIHRAAESSSVGETARPTTHR